MQLLAGEGGGGGRIIGWQLSGNGWISPSVRQSAEKDEEDLKQRKVL